MEEWKLLVVPWLESSIFFIAKQGQIGTCQLYITEVTVLFSWFYDILRISYKSTENLSIRMRMVFIHF